MVVLLDQRFVPAGTAREVGVVPDRRRARCQGCGAPAEEGMVRARSGEEPSVALCAMDVLRCRRNFPRATGKCLVCTWTAQGVQLKKGVVCEGCRSALVAFARKGSGRSRLDETATGGVEAPRKRMSTASVTDPDDVVKGTYDWSGIRADIPRASPWLLIRSLVSRMTSLELVCADGGVRVAVGEVR